MFEGSKLQEVGTVGYVGTFTVLCTVGVHILMLWQTYNLDSSP